MRFPQIRFCFYYTIDTPPYYTKHPPRGVVLVHKLIRGSTGVFVVGIWHYRSRLAAGNSAHLGDFRRLVLQLARIFKVLRHQHDSKTAPAQVNSAWNQVGAKQASIIRASGMECCPEGPSHCPQAVEGMIAKHPWWLAGPRADTMP